MRGLRVESGLESLAIPPPAWRGAPRGTLGAAEATAGVRSNALVPRIVVVDPADAAAGEDSRERQR
jgi:hypothetical protein